MPLFDGIFMRDSLNDTGVTPSPGHPSHSPDIICHEQVASPKTYFTNNYATDPNQPVQLGSQTNFVYVRAKNLSANPQTGWYISVYRCPSSLYLTPNLWKPHKLKTLSGQDYVSLDTVSRNGIVVGNDNFLLNGLSSNYFCVVGVASRQTDPVLPDKFNSYSDYWDWIRNNQNVCGRNLNRIKSFPDRQFDRMDEFSNPETNDVPILIMVTASGPLPPNTIFGVSCAPCGINVQKKISEGTTLTASGMVPANFEGVVNTFASLPAGTRWPPSAKIITTLYIGQDASSRSARYATPLRLLGLTAKDLGRYHAKNGVLVLLGSTGTEFIS